MCSFCQFMDINIRSPNFSKVWWSSSCRQFAFLVTTPFPVLDLIFRLDPVVVKLTEGRRGTHFVMKCAKSLTVQISQT